MECFSYKWVCHAGMEASCGECVGIAEYCKFSLLTTTVLAFLTFTVAVLVKVTECSHHVDVMSEYYLIPAYNLHMSYQKLLPSNHLSIQL